jgi:hypothetical protein
MLLLLLLPAVRVGASLVAPPKGPVEENVDVDAGESELGGESELLLALKWNWCWGAWELCATCGKASSHSGLTRWRCAALRVLFWGPNEKTVIWCNA